VIGVTSASHAIKVTPVSASKPTISGLKTKIKAKSPTYNLHGSHFGASANPTGVTAINSKVAVSGKTTATATA